ncbi:hypothetical protein ABK905_05510 [Acerihabitans sp. KWT182]|uniref:DUF637 domain-containing protein n=1 Tax=Acerihabitans sp. KWT182 TaxID=3157919 RepID=A0AAU7QBS0_9GAMM
MVQQGATQDEINAELTKNAQGDLPTGQAPATALVMDWGEGMSLVGGTLFVPATGTAAVAGGAVLGTIADAETQFYEMGPNDEYNYINTIIAAGAGALTQGKSIYFTAGVNMGGALLESELNGQNATGSMIEAAVGSLLSAKSGEYMNNAIDIYGIPPVISSTFGEIGGSMTGVLYQIGVDTGIKKVEEQN